MFIGLSPTNISKSSIVGRASTPAAGDPYFANVVSLLNFDTDLTDVIGNTWTDPSCDLHAGRSSGAVADA